MVAAAAAAAAVSSSYEPQSADGSSPRMEIDLRVTKDTLHILHVSTLALELQNYAAWTQSRDRVPYALARQGMTWQEWTTVFDKADALWERRTLEGIQVNRDIVCRRKARSRYIKAFYAVTLAVLVTSITLGCIVGTIWMVGLGFGSMGLVPIVVWMLVTKYEIQFLTVTHDINKDNMERDWALLAEEQRRNFESIGVDVQPIREDHSGKYGPFFAKLLGRDFTMTDGLRFSFDQEGHHMPLAGTNENNPPRLSNDPTTSDTAIQDLDRLLHLNQTGGVTTEEYQLLKASIVSTISLPFQYKSLPKKNYGSRPVATTAGIAAVGADNDAADEKQVFLELV
jgi:hypothetical protein